MTNPLLSRKALAAALGRHPLTITKWEADGMPIAERGGPGRASRYSLPAVVAWYIQRELAARGVAGAEINPAAERALLDRRRREEVEQRLERTRGDWVPRETFREVLTPVVTAIRARLLAAPRAWTPTLTREARERGPGAVEAALSAHVRELLTILATLPVRELGAGTEARPS